MSETVAIIGAGIGGFLLVAHLGSAGYKIRLHDIDDTKLADLRARGGVETDGIGEGFAPLEKASTDLPSIVEGAGIIIVVVGGHRQSTVATALAPLLRDGQTILLIQGNTGGALVFRRVLDRAGCKAKVDTAEMDNFPYSARQLGPAKIKPIVTKRWLQIASFPGKGREGHYQGGRSGLLTSLRLAAVLPVSCGLHSHGDHWEGSRRRCALSSKGL